jgi:hypothetical protein
MGIGARLRPRRRERESDLDKLARSMLRESAFGSFGFLGRRRMTG